MTRLHCQTGRWGRATGRGYTLGTGGCICTGGQGLTVLCGPALVSCPAILVFYCAFSPNSAGSLDLPRYGIAADTSLENPLSTLLESTAVTT
jgi:hypothetical protein